MFPVIRFEFDVLLDRDRQTEARTERQTRIETDGRTESQRHRDKDTEPETQGHRDRHG